ncbi:helix-hairpin-helix domain-containing protein [Streptococcus rifensis]
MAKKKGNRKKQLRKQLADLRRAGQNLVDTGVQRVQQATEKVAETASQVAETVTDRVQETAEAVVEKVEELKEQKATKAFDKFVAELDGVPTARLETFYAEGISSLKDFANWTEKELLALKGIGPATIKQLKDLGATFKG